MKSFYKDIFWRIGILTKELNLRTSEKKKDYRLHVRWRKSFPSLVLLKSSFLLRWNFQVLQLIRAFMIVSPCLLKSTNSILSLPVNLTFSGTSTSSNLPICWKLQSVSISTSWWLISSVRKPTSLTLDGIEFWHGVHLS